jgi:VCBS repeat-containing protein/probable HAF family extracellular repeat protein
MATTPIVINNISDLQAIQNNPSGSYVLGANIDAAGLLNVTIVDFSGVLNGNGYSIDNLQNPLFHKIDTQGVVQNLNLTNVHLYDAALALDNEGVVSACSVTGAVLGHNIEGGAAGLVNFNGGTGVISNSYSTASVNGNFNSGSIGGLVDTNVGLITGSYATGALTGAHSGGGLVGDNGIGPNGEVGTILNSYATGSIMGDAVGGLVGTNNANITDSYASGLLIAHDASSLTAGLIAFSFPGSVTAIVTNSYWDTETAGTSFSAGGTGLTTNQLQSGTLPAGFDPTIWFDTASQFPELRWQVPTSYTFKTIDLGTSSAAYDINNLGQIVGYYRDTTFRAFIYDISSATYITINDPSGSNGTDGRGINDLGQIVGSYANGITNLGYLYSGGTYTTLFHPSAVFGTFAQGINDTGQVVGYYGDSNAIPHGFLYAGGTYTTLDDPLATNGTQAHDINDAAQIVGTYTDGTGTHGFLYSGGTYTTINDPLAAPGQTFATGINDLGQIAGHYYDLSGGAHGFLDIGGNFTTIDDNLVTGGTFVQDINNAGQIVGYYYTDGSVQHAFFATASTNHSPVASAIAADVNEDTNNPAVKLLAVFTDPDLSDTFTFMTDVTGTLGLVTNNHDGTFSYDPNGKFESLGVGETATDTFTYTVTDNHGAGSTATATVTIHGENDAPVASPDVAGVLKGGTVVGNVRTNDHDPDIHDVLLVTAVNGSSMLIGQPIKGTYGTLTLNTDGSYTYVAKNNAQFGAQDIFQYTVSDGHGGTSTSTLTVGISFPALVINTAQLTGSVDERQLVTGKSGTDQTSGVITFSVPDAANRPTSSIDASHQTITYQDASGHSYALTSAQIAAFEAAFSVADVGTANAGKAKWTYSITDSTLDFLGAGETVTVTTPIVIDDHHGNVRTENVVVTINGADDKPIAAADAASAMQTGAVSADAAHGVLVNDTDPDIHDILRVGAINGVAGNVGQPIAGKYGTLTLNVDGSYNYFETAPTVPTKGALDVFHYTVNDEHGGSASSTLSVAVPALQSAAKIFENYGTNGEIAVLAQLSQAAYHLVPGVEVPGDGINILDPNAEAAFTYLPVGLRLLSAADLPSLAPENVPSDPNFPNFGLVNGIYLDGNAAALVALSSDSLFVSFRGTNDLNLSSFHGTLDQLFNSGISPDTVDWSPSGMSSYYALLKPLITAVDDYLATHHDITHVYVTGHSLGASMAQEFMSQHAGSEFQAVMFANPGFPSSGPADDPRITNIAISTDPIPFRYSVDGNIYQIVDYDGNSGGGFFGPHDMTLYRDVVQFLSSQDDSIPQPGLAADGHQDLVKIFANITNSGPSSILQTDPWTVSLPTGVVPSPFNILPTFDPRTDTTIAPKEILGVIGGGTLTGGAGNDTFTFAPNFGKVTITNFHPGEDIIQIEKSLFGTAKAVAQNITADPQDPLHSALITLDPNDTIELRGITAAQLNAQIHLHGADYLFHVG